MSISKLIAAAALTFVASAASAAGVTYNASAGATSTASGAVTFDFNTPNVLSDGYATYDKANALIASSQPYAARPPLSTGGFFSVGLDVQPSSASVSFAGQGASYFGFYLGSADSYNSVTLFDTHGAQLVSLNGNQIAAANNSSASGNQSEGFFLNFYASGTTIGKVTFASPQNAFESDNHAYIAAVPEPETYAMLGAGLGLLAFVGRRKAKRAA